MLFVVPGNPASTYFMNEIAPGVVCVPTSFVNTYLIGEPGEPWAIVDTGLRPLAWKIKAAAEERFGRDSRPVAIFLTHGHFDHSGSARTLADHWGVPVYAHALEVPYLTGRSGYPPPDPTVGGAIAMLSRVLPHDGIDLGGRLRTFTPFAGGAGQTQNEGPLPGMEGWKWVFTPGHSPGHVVFFREADRTLIAGDSVATLDMDSYLELAIKQQEISTAGAPFISDWDKYAASLQTVAALEPVTLACGHGIPMSGGEVAGDLERFARHFAPPPHGRYVATPAVTDLRGLDSLPPKPADPFPYLVGAAALGITLALAVLPKRGR